MSAAAILAIHSFKRVQALVTVMGLLLAGFQILLAIAAAALDRSNSFGQIAALMPDFVRHMFGPSLLAALTYSGVVCLGYFHVVVMAALVGLCIALATESASELETRFLDLVLSRPVSRIVVITRTVVLLFACTAFVLGLMMLGTWMGISWNPPREAPRPSARLIGALALNLGALMLCWGGLALAIGSISRRRGVAGSIAGLLALACFLLDVVARVWKPAEAIAWLSPFRYFDPFSLVLGRALPAHHLVVLAGVGAAGIALAYVFFSRRDV